MKKEFRVKKNKEFQEAFKRGKSFANRQFVVYSLQKDEQSHFRIGLSVSKKIGNAVMRNQIKRYIRQAFHELDADLKQNYDFIIIARKPTADMDFFEIKKSLIHVLKLSKVLNKPKYGNNKPRLDSESS
ncbi:ribonuclease P protein component [Cytobacillus horneckiae]|uniref:Ribonuclease P protein component n=1 Tax=Cytobacillus horneckiae TaxID=549687 RepID=A0A2N0Z8M8_9BACI|nr:ribonuclease P protein component [Cytobacillus horneckiae]MBN6889953.1 ribonuclease P protein component [Cytobacillus horneckiae]MCM3179431.1 ribonuclease P protein component [Cytobacillus horneckiae]MEC1157756.1 ribonuclease P protein component [Cytobacillus horneckiae]MED2938074.1 ribonuclease P protein component [Cytobacillus horneckiae]PKG25873.1 ribonuclease P protein component [Cytobacillus horneckiae]